MTWRGCFHGNNKAIIIMVVTISSILCSYCTYTLTRKIYILQFSHYNYWDERFRHSTWIWVAGCARCDLWPEGYVQWFCLERAKQETQRISVEREALMKNISILFWQKQQGNGDTKREVIEWKRRKWEARSENCLLSPRCFIALYTHAAWVCAQT